MVSHIQNEFQGTARFIIQKRLGAGGFGVVYQAYDREHNSTIALKTLHHADAKEIYRFKKEFRASADIAHPNLAALYELFSEQDQWFFTMEMVYGESFLEYVKLNSVEDELVETMPTLKLSAGKMAAIKDNGAKLTGELKGEKLIIKKGASKQCPCEADLVKLRAALKQLVLGLDALHKGNKLHRDIKPSNVLVTKEGRVVILDFGLVSELTRQGVNNSGEYILGTPAYMSPEQGIGHPLSPASDWYSVGVMLFEALTGELPFFGSPVQVILDKQRLDPVAPAFIVSGVPDDLNQLCLDLLQRDAEQRPTGEEILRFLDHKETLEELSATASKAKILTIPFIGREKELAILREAWQLTEQGQSVRLYIQGRSGMGKSALVRHFLEGLAESNPALLVFSGRCYKQETVPYKALDSIIDLLSLHLKSLSSLEVETILPLDVLALARIFPVLLQVEAVANAERQVLNIADSKELRRKAFRAMRELLARLAQKRDLIFFIDDLQWGDLDSAALLSEILRQPDAPRLLFIGCYRSEESESSLFLQSLLSLQATQQNINVREIDLEELSGTESQKLAVALLGEEWTVKHADIIVQESKGSPFFISELVQYALTQTTTSIQPTTIDMTIDKVVSARIDQLSNDGRHLLEVVAVSGQPLPRMVAKEAANIPADEQIILILRTGHLLRSTANSDYEEIDTYHDRIREAVLTILPEPLQQDYHRHLAQALEGDKTVDPERLAKHFQQAGDKEKAYSYTVAAADQAAEALAFDQAARLYKLALEFAPIESTQTHILRVKLGDTLANAGRGAEAAQTYLIAANDSSAVQRLELQHKAAEQLLISGHIDEGLRELNNVLGAMGMRLAKTTYRAIFSLLLQRIQVWMRGIKYNEQDIAQLSSQEVMRIDLCWSAVKGLSMVDHIRASEFQTYHLLIALKTGESFRVARALVTEACYRSASRGGQRQFAYKLLAEAKAIAERINNRYMSDLTILVAGFARFQEGQWKEALRLIESAEETMREHCTGISWEIDSAHVYALIIINYLGEWKEIYYRLPILLKEATDRGDIYCDIYLRTSVQYIFYLMSDEPDKGRQELYQAIKKWSQQGFYLQHWHVLLAEVQIDLYSGQPDNAWNSITKKWSSLKRSLLMEVQIVLIEAYYLHARSALAVAATGRDQKTMLANALRAAKRIERENMLYGNGWVKLIRAGVAATSGKYPEAMEWLTLAEKDFEAADMALFLAVTRRRRGQLMGGDEGKRLIASVDSWMATQQIKNPVRIADMLAPGRWQK